MNITDAATRILSAAKLHDGFRKDIEKELSAAFDAGQQTQPPTVSAPLTDAEIAAFRDFLRTAPAQ